MRLGAPHRGTGPHPPGRARTCDGGRRRAAAAIAADRSLPPARPRREGPVPAAPVRQAISVCARGPGERTRKGRMAYAKAPADHGPIASSRRSTGPARDPPGFNGAARPLWGRRRSAASLYERPVPGPPSRPGSIVLSYGLGPPEQGVELSVTSSGIHGFIAVLIVRRRLLAAGCQAPADFGERDPVNLSQHVALRHRRRGTGGVRDHDIAGHSTAPGFETPRSPPAGTGR